MPSATISPFLRPLVIFAGIMVYFVIKSEVRGSSISLPKALIIGSWFLVGVALLGFVQIRRKKEFGWMGSLFGVLALGVIAALATLALQKAGFIFQ